MSVKKIFGGALICAACAGVAFGQQTIAAAYPFPQNVVYPNGHSQSTITSTRVTEWYNRFKTAHIHNCPDKGTMPTADDNNNVKVEGLGWAMIAAAYMGDKEIFDGIYRFYNANTNQRAGGMMVWTVTCQNTPDNEGSATDGDLDVAFALVVASWQWGGNYLDEAKKVITRCEQLIVTCNNGGPDGTAIRSLAGGYSNGPYGGGCNSYTDMSYFTPAFFRIFAEVSGKNIWNQLADDAYIHLERNAHATTGLVSDWQNVNTGAPMAGPSGNSHDTTYRHDASRVAWRISLDYLWNGNERAKAWLTKVTGWVHSNGISNLREGHARDGTVLNQTAAGMAFLGSFAAGSLANDNETVRSAFMNAIASRDDEYWYHRHTGNMYLLTLTGNMWNESMVGGTGFTIMAAIDGGGSVSRNPNKTRYESGEKITLTAEPNTGWTFDGWSGDIGSADSKSPSIEITAGSANINVTAKFVLTGGVELVKNGNFADGMTDWTLNTWDNSQATASVLNGAVTININTLPSSGEVYNMQLVQASLPLLKGNTYTVSFEASAAGPRVMEVMCQKATDPWTGYFSEDVNLTTAMQEFSFDFEMTEDDDLVSRLGFNVGHSTENVTIRNVSVMLKQGTSIKPQSISQTATKGTSLRVSAKKSGISVKFKAKTSGSTSLRLYGLRGELAAKTELNTVAGKSYSHTFSGVKISNGFYIVRMHSSGKVEQSKVIMRK
ncbi:MAG: carbohydrate binding domain-containing protein [Chitinispirillales bacterium]|jgi:uncharacterized repeat protein (TIGR02543 family)|nr:carbohydrate binding domain-containing protein [Chitinispirillales bacterium]